MKIPISRLIRELLMWKAKIASVSPAHKTFLRVFEFCAWLTSLLSCSVLNSLPSSNYANR